MSRELIVKVCGLRDGENIRAVEAAGADMFGFIFYPGSPRFVSEVPSYLPVTGERVGVFVKPSLEEVMQRVEAFGLTAVQLYGATGELCKLLRKREVKVMLAGGVVSEILGLAAKDDGLTQAAGGDADMLVFDTPCEGYGGSGRRFDWSVLRNYVGTVPFLLSGGIGPESVGDVLALEHPMLAGVDLNSRFELEPGLKDAGALKLFIERLKNYGKQD